MFEAEGEEIRDILLASGNSRDPGHAECTVQVDERRFDVHVDISKPFDLRKSVESKMRLYPAAKLVTLGSGVGYVAPDQAFMTFRCRPDTNNTPFLGDRKVNVWATTSIIKNGQVVSEPRDLSKDYAAFIAEMSRYVFKDAAKCKDSEPLASGLPTSR
ncbi:hypothetical protein GCM10009612_01310 [Streptomyces beijiangensis]